MKNDNGNRWVIVNKNTGNTRRTLVTRSAARALKRRNERIFDNLTKQYVR